MSDTMPGFLEEFKKSKENPDIAIAVVAIQALTRVIEQSTATTMMELEIALRVAADTLKTPHQASDDLCSTISLTASCELFLRYVTRCFLDFEDFEECKEQLIKRGRFFASTSLASRNRIAELGHSFVRDGMVVFTLGSSRVVRSILYEAAKTKNFSVIVTEGRPSSAGYDCAENMAKIGIPTTVVPDAAIGYVMEQVDVVIVGAEGVVESGGVVNMIGTMSCAMVAKAMNKPFYVAAESYKFARLYPLNQRDFPESVCIKQKPQNDLHEIDSPHVTIMNPLADYTPPEYITLLFTDLGVLTPSAVSDELIKLYQ